MEVHQVSFICSMLIIFFKYETYKQVILFVLVQTECISYSVMYPYIRMNYTMVWILGLAQKD